MPMYPTRCHRCHAPIFLTGMLHYRYETWVYSSDGTVSTGVECYCGPCGLRIRGAMMSYEDEQIIREGEAERAAQRANPPALSPSRMESSDTLG